MLTLLTGEEFPMVGEPASEAAVRILCMAEAYGPGRAFIRFWKGEGGLLLALLDGTASLLPGTAGLEELALFLSIQEEIRLLRTDRETAVELAPLLPGWAVETGDVMTPARPFSPVTAAEWPAREIYPLLRECFGETVPPFEAWYGDVNHRQRHGLCRIAAVGAGGIPVASAMTTAECRGGAVIGAVATLPAYRGRGYASACVSSLTARLQTEGRRIYLSPKNDYAAKLYAKLGYVPCGGWGTLRRPEFFGK